ncbi:trypsin-like peptidase domain-containing protein [Kitasatospora misakiensis]|uniref:Trypsin-like peptidase domain-containing protein n=1 Tax=Kitasatospora misakiensis TaxID=67330 RepID=A0ABW0X3Q1_9ACTN
MTLSARPDLAESEELRRCTVMITVAGEFHGSGFLVAPGLAVTCAHVVARAVAAGAPVGVRHPTGDRTVPGELIRLAPETSNGRGSYPFPDLALLALPDWADHPVARLAAAEAEPDAVLTALGYSTYTPTPGARPDTLRLRVVGLADRYLGVRGDGIRDGHSGSMLVNGNGLVQGVLKHSRHFEQDAGGFYTPVGALTALLGAAGVALPDPLRPAPVVAGPPSDEGQMVAALMAFRRLDRPDGRYDLLRVMGRHLGLEHAFEAEDGSGPRDHLHRIVRACHGFRDSLAALQALYSAMAELAPDDGALVTLGAVIGRALGTRPTAFRSHAHEHPTGIPEGWAPNGDAEDWSALTRWLLGQRGTLPVDELIELMAELRTIAAPENPARYLPEDAPGLRHPHSKAGQNTLPGLLKRISELHGNQRLGLLVAFLCALGGDLEVARHGDLPALRRFLATHADRIPDAARDSTEERLIVQVRLDEVGPPSAADTRYHMHISYYRQPLEGGPFRRVGSHYDSEAFTRSELLSTGGARLIAWQELRDALRGEPFVRYEFLLPRSALGYAAELWSIDDTGRALGQHQQVVVRQLERYTAPNLDVVPWRRRWKQLQVRCADPAEVLKGIHWASLDPLEKDQLGKHLRSEKDVACVGLAAPYDELDPTVQYVVDSAMYFEGVPVMIWRRVAGDVPTLVTALQEHGPTRLAELPDVIRDYRQDIGGPTPNPDNAVTLLWDDPDCVDPNQDHAYPGMIG